VKRIALCALSALPASALAQHLDEPVAPASFEAIEAARAEARMSHAGASWILYLNPDGGRYFGAADNDSRSNRSTIVQNHVGSAIDIPPYPFGAASWANVLACVRDHFAPFDLHVTDVDPGDTPHLETVVGGSSWDMNVGGLLGIAAMPCEPVPNLIQFAFAADMGGLGEGEICDTAAQETAHAFGLDHETLCQDVLSYDRCGPKSFVDANASCGEYGARGCICGGSSQNSYRHLLEWVGPHGGGGVDPPDGDPAVTILSPTNGQAVPPGFTVTVEVAGPVTSVQIAFDETWGETRSVAPWTFVAPADLSAGQHVVQVVGQGAGGDVADWITVNVTPGAPPPDEGDDGGGGGYGRGGCGAAGAGPGLLSALLLPLAMCRRRGRSGW
jgi:hypothetical protein